MTAVKIVDRLEGKRLRQLSEFKDMLCDDYLSDTTHPQTKFIFSQFFNASKSGENIKDDGQDRLRLLNISYGLPSMICETIADYVGEPTGDLFFMIYDYVYRYVWGGYAVFVMGIEDGNFVVREHDPDGYVKFDDGRERLLTYLEADAGNEIKKYVLVQEYLDGNVNNKLYERKGGTLITTSDAIFGVEVPLSTLPATEFLPDQEAGRTNRNPIVVVHAAKTTDHKYGMSDVRRIRSLVSSIEVEVVNIQDQFLKHLQAKLAIPASSLPIDQKTGLVDLRKLEVIAMEAGETVPQYIFNTNPLIKESFEQIDKMIRQIAAITSIPVEFFGLNNVGGAESGDAKRLRLSKFIKKTERIRVAFKQGIEDIFELRKEFGFNGDEDVIVDFGEVFPTEAKEVVNELSIAVEARLTSRKRAVMRYNEVDEDVAAEIIAEIGEENATVSAADLGI